MAVIEVSEDGVRRSAGGEVFGQAREWAGKVSGLRADGPAITRTERLLNYENCHGEGITEALEKAQDVHLAACEAGTPDPEVLAERLATGALESGWGVFRDGPASTPACSVRPGWPGTGSCWRTRPPGNTGRTRCGHRSTAPRRRRPLTEAASPRVPAP